MQAIKITTNELGKIEKVVTTSENTNLQTGECYLYCVTKITYSTEKHTVMFKRVTYKYPTRAFPENKRLSHIDMSIKNHETGEYYLTDSHSMKAATKLALCLLS